MVIYVTDYQPKRSPISTSSSSVGGGGAYFFFYYFLPPFSSAFLSAAGAALAGSLAVGADADEPPKLKKELMSCPLIALANNLVQYLGTLAPAAAIRAFNFSSV